MTSLEFRNRSEIGVAVAVDKLSTQPENVTKGRITTDYRSVLCVRGALGFQFFSFANVHLRRNLPAFVLHLPIRPVLQLNEDCGFDHDKAQASSSSSIGPYQAAFRLDSGFALRPQSANVDQSGKTSRIAHGVKPHASRAQVDRLYLQFLAL